MHIHLVVALWEKVIFGERVVYNSMASLLGLVGDFG
jgi:hypothetical protein